MLLESINEKNFIGKLGVLFVEDNQHDLEDLAYILNKKVDILFTASNGKEGLVTYTKNEKDIDIIITDIRMPYMSGIEMVNHIKKTNPNIKVIYLSAHNETDILLEALNSGADGYILKPISVQSKLISKLFQLSKDIFKDKMLERYNKTLNLVLDCINNIIVITNGIEIAKSNEAFLEFFGYDTLEKFKNDYKCICDLFIEEDDYLKSSYGGDKTWADIVLEVPEAKAKIKNQNGEDVIFLVQVNPLSISDDDALFVIEFTDITHVSSNEVHVDIEKL
jgi:two-component system cell cycle response regulator